MVEVQQYVEKLAEEHAMAESDVEEIYNEKLQQCHDAGQKGEQAEQRAIKMLLRAFSRRQQSSLEPVEGVFLGVGDRYDAVRWERQRAVEAYQENPQKAIKDGVIAVACPPEESGNITGGGVVVVGEKNGWAIVSHENNEGILQHNFASRNPATGEVDGTDEANTEVEDGWRLYPLDTQRKFNSGDDNPNFGRPVAKHEWTRRGLGVFKTDEHDARRASVTLRGKSTISEPPLYDAVQLEARVNEADNEDLLYVNGYDETEINPNPELEGQLPEPDELIEKYYGGTDRLHDLQSAYEFLGDSDRPETIFVKADVLTMDLEPNANNTLRLVLNDMDFVGTEAVEWEATVWLPDWQAKYIDFAVDSRVYVVGRAQLQDAYDPEAGERTSEEQEISIDGQGIYADPTFKIPREDDVEEVSEDDFDFSADDDGFEEDDW